MGETADVNELYDLDEDPHELINRYNHREMADVCRRMMGRLYALLEERGDNFRHWMTTMFEVGGKTYDASMSDFEENQALSP